MKKILISLLLIVVVGVLFFATPLGVYAMSFFQKSLAGMAQMTYTDEVTVTDIKINSLSKITVTMESKANTVPNRIYTVWLYLDDEKVTSLPVSWAVGEAPKKRITFSGLHLDETIVVDVDIIY